MLVNFSGHPSTWTTQRMLIILTELLCSRLTEKRHEETDSPETTLHFLNMAHNVGKLYWRSPPSELPYLVPNVFLLLGMIQQPML